MLMSKWPSIFLEIPVIETIYDFLVLSSLSSPLSGRQSPPQPVPVPSAFVVPSLMIQALGGLVSPGTAKTHPAQLLTLMMTWNLVTAFLQLRVMKQPQFISTVSSPLEQLS